MGFDRVDEYRLLFNNMPQGFALHEIICDDSGKVIDYRFLAVNPAFERLTGLKAGDLVGHTVLEVMPGTEKSWIVKYGNVALTGETICFESFSGELRRHYEVTAYRPAPNQFAVIFLDVTERKMTVEALRESQRQAQFLASCLEHSSQPFVVGHFDGRLASFNKAFVELTGYSREELMSIDWARVLTPTHWLPFEMQKIEELLKTGEPARYEKEYIRKDQSVIPVEVFTHGSFDGNGHLEFLYAFITDISDRKKAEAAISAEKERLSVTLRSIGDGVITTDVHGHVMLLNKVAETLTGWTTEEAVGKPLSEIFVIVDEATRMLSGNPVEEVLRTGNVVELANHTVLRHRRGGEHVIADSGAPIRDRNSTIIGVVLVFRDITEKQKLLDYAQRSDKLASLGVLAGGIAHDFNNLLAGLFGYIDLAKSASPPGEARECLDEALGIFSRARDLTQQLLTFAKGGTPAKTTKSLKPLLIEWTRFALSGSKVSPIFEIDDDLWPADFDPNQIGQVIDNIVINAQQAMPRGGTINVSAMNVTMEDRALPALKAGNYVRISIRDAGIGIPQSVLPHIFDPFFTTKQKGTGLGLATAYSIIKKHDGEITVESVIDQGTTFQVFLPATDQPVVEEVATPQLGHRGRGRILIMDDETGIRQVLERMMHRMGYDVEQCAEGRDALSRIREAREQGKPFFLVFMDLTIPGGMGGKEAVAELRKTDSSTRVIVASGYSSDPIMAAPESFGFDGKIQKPFRLAEINLLMERMVQKRGVDNGDPGIE